MCSVQAHHTINWLECRCHICNSKFCQACFYNKDVDPVPVPLEPPPHHCSPFTSMATLCSVDSQLTSHHMTLTLSEQYCDNVSTLLNRPPTPADARLGRDFLQACGVLALRGAC